jgi:alpha-L-rhamnosidase
MLKLCKKIAGQVALPTMILFFLLGATACSPTRLDSLKVEYEETPLGIDTEKPRFSWQMDSRRQGISQRAYQIVITDETGREVWDSGQIEDDRSLNIEYAGEALQPTTRYYWKVNVWSQNVKKQNTSEQDPGQKDTEKQNTGQQNVGKHNTGSRKDKPLSAESWFETGLMDPSIEAWSGAKWIGGGDDDRVLYPDYLPTFNIHYTIQLDRESGTTKAGFVYGANDPRLMDKNLNIYNLQNEKNASYVEVELDISGLNNGETAYLNVYRVGYAPGDSREIPLQRLPIPISLINKQNRYDSHEITLKTTYSVTEFHLGGERGNRGNGDNRENRGKGNEKDEGNTNKLGSVVINPIGSSGDYICFPHLCEIGFTAQPGQSASFSQVEVRNYRVPNNLLFSEKLDEPGVPSLFTVKTGDIGSQGLTIANNSYKITGGETGTFITANTQRNAMPMLRTTFQSRREPVDKARLYVTSRGIYEVYMNGKRVGDDYFNPGLTQYNKHQMYQTYDVTELVKPGENAMGAILGEGWWSGAITYMGYLWNLFGDCQSLLAKLVITYADGTQETVVSNPDTWHYFNDGPVIYGSFFQGEVYDARKEATIEGWSEASYNPSGWEKAKEVNPVGVIVHDRVIEQNRMPAVNDFSTLKLIGQYGQTVKKIDELTAIAMEEVRPGVYVYDMGQNMVGIPHITLSGETEGKEIKLRFAEVTYPDLPEFRENSGMIMLENIRGALAQDTYITKGGNEVIQPRFTFHGYRYIEITGIEKPLPLQLVKGEVLSSIHELASAYETSHQKVNRLWENIVWSSRANFLSIPTDCPQRNERMGWSGDISVFSRTATYMANLAQFLRRHMLAMRDTQREDGRFADVAPVGGGFGGILWGSAGITVAWESYMQYNDTRMLAEHYGAMKSYIQYLVEYIDTETGVLTEGYLGDWLGPEQRKNDNSLLWEAYFIYDLERMRRIATLLNKPDDAAWFDQLHGERKRFFNQTYIDRETGQTIHSGFKEPRRKGEVIGTQTSYVLPLAFDICDENIREQVMANLIARIKNESPRNDGEAFAPYSLMTGFIGTAWINRVLSDHGYSETAYRILQQTGYPSWLYSVDQGATTIWERLNSYTKEEGFGGNNSMNSFNHYSFGAIGSWMYNHSLGIERDEESPGFKRFILKPEPDPTGGITWAKGHYDSMYGRIESEWKIDTDRGLHHYRFKVPSNTTATLYLPADDHEKIKEGNKPLTSSPYIQLLENNGEKGEKRNESGETGTICIQLLPGEYRFTVKE